MRGAVVLSLLCATAGCATAPAGGPPVPAFAEAEIRPDPEGRCWGRDVAPAVIETVTVQEQASPPVLGPDGTVIAPATYRSVIRQQIARERREVAFETLCPPSYTTEFVESLQRALAARGYYRGEVDGRMSAALRRAVQDFQRRDGPDSPLLSLESARRLGLVALSREEIQRL